MGEPQIIRSPSGEEMVVLPRAEYEALVERADRGAEDADDVAIYDARKAELDAGGGVLPPEVSAAILRGDSRLKVSGAARRSRISSPRPVSVRGICPIWKADAAQGPLRRSRNSRKR